jgi:HEAT repeat protein
MTAVLVLIATMLDPNATVAQRNDACYALRGEHSAEAVKAVGQALGDRVVRTCAARDLREAGALDELIAALAGTDADIQMAAARELGEMRDARALEALGRAALDVNMMVSASAIDALGARGDKSALPYLLRAAVQPGVAGINALEQAARLHDTAVLPIARSVIERGDIAAQVVALTILGDFGDAADLPGLRDLAAKSDPVYSRGRGFGFMPPIDLGRAAQNAMAKINARASHATQVP